MQRLRLLIIAGGQSEEHEVSLTSARSVLEALEGHARLEARVVVIGRDGGCLAPEASLRAVAAGHSPPGAGPRLPGLPALEACDLVLPLIHGTLGEDGSLQGFLELVGVPYIGSGVLASALCMDKAMAKQVLAAAGLPQVAHRLLTAAALHEDLAGSLARVAELPAPWFVKPNNQGSSVGISKVTDPRQLPAALAEAARFGRRIIVEAGVPEVREVEVAVLGNAQPQASVVGEISYAGDFYDYATKYTPGRAQLHLPAALTPAQADRVRGLACQAFAALDCAGLARVDFFIGGDGGVLVNELNTLPGFTPLSMYPKLWAHSGLPYPALIERLCELALARHAEAGPTRQAAGRRFA